MTIRTKLLDDPDLPEDQEAPVTYALTYATDNPTTWPWPTAENVETTYVERCVPAYLVDAINKLIDNALLANGYQPEEL